MLRARKIRTASYYTRSDVIDEELRRSSSHYLPKDNVDALRRT